MLEPEPVNNGNVIEELERGQYDIIVSVLGILWLTVELISYVLTMYFPFGNHTAGKGRMRSHFSIVLIFHYYLVIIILQGLSCCLPFY